MLPRTGWSRDSPAYPAAAPSQPSHLPLGPQEPRGVVPPAGVLRARGWDQAGGPVGAARPRRLICRVRSGTSGAGTFFQLMLHKNRPSFLRPPPPRPASPRRLGSTWVLPLREHFWAACGKSVPEYPALDRSGHTGLLSLTGHRPLTAQLWLASAWLSPPVDGGLLFLGSGGEQA